MLTVACVLKKSDEYDTDYVDMLRGGLSRHLKKFDFMHITGSQWPGWWCKMELFRPSVKGDFLYLDLDTVVVGDLSDIIARKKLTVLRDFNVPDRMASGVMFIPEDERPPIWTAWIHDPKGHVAKWGGHGDGGFLSQFWHDKADRWQDVLPGQIVSYKNHVRGKGVPRNARLVCFHGRPRPRDVNWKVE